MYGSLDGYFRESKISRPYSSYVEFFCDIIDVEPPIMKRLQRRKYGRMP
jgi:hypothetical protein